MQARGKSGPLFNFDVHDDVRLLNDATVEKDESHAGKVGAVAACPSETPLSPLSPPPHPLAPLLTPSPSPFPSKFQVMLRSWYERNKHIFPASRWEPYDPEKKWEKYSISDKGKARA